MHNGWIGVDFDGTLTKTMEWGDWGEDIRIGDDIEPMIERVKQWRAEGRDVRILTARVARGWDDRGEQWLAISHWSHRVFGEVLHITSEKDPEMIALWDDRCVQVVRNTGMTPEELGRQQYTRLPPLKNEPTGEENVY